MIGKFYKYPNSKKRFLLIKIDGFIYRFQGGHWCTDCVFQDMVLCAKKKKNDNDKQMKLF